MLAKFESKHDMLVPCCFALCDLHMQMILPMCLSVLDPLFQDLLRLLDELPVEIDRVGRDTSIGVVLAEDELRGLLVVLLHLAAVGLSFLRELLGAGSITARIGVLRLSGGLA